jgi:hypothetical protein
MAFPLSGGRSLGVEYDGAYWHQGQEERDLRKTFMIEGTGQYYVLRKVGSKTLRTASAQTLPQARRWRQKAGRSWPGQPLPPTVM